LALMWVEMVDCQEFAY